MQTHTIRLMNHRFEVPCEPEDQAKLEQAADFLDNKLDLVPHLKGETKILMVALNICYDYLQLKKDTLAYTDHLEKQLDRLALELNNNAADETP
ncbi:cell division protein ZapA [Thiomicrospira microaerophila]|uniref:cell division protein ZapA n=1 Tax=Thiomicrospira microaerophila TaxID=406020 RepID=UPI0020100B89|nr:cell division protein ZapA [Thiomicrospira microaerophila]UQB42991.1 cell division protein ZapA [Thiomicrospira microaerophila]